MYIPRVNAVTDLATLHGLIEAHPLGSWVAMREGELVANHIPFLIDRSRGTFGTLVAHVARANPIWRECLTPAPSLVVFQGADQYITPTWYADKREHGKVVPTWNYVVVHAHGTPVVIDDKDWLRRHVNQLVDTHESREPVPWKVSDAPRDYVERELGAIVGIEIPIDRLTGKWKVSQNRSDADKRGIVTGLRARGDERSREMADLVAACARPAAIGGTDAGVATLPAPVISSAIAQLRTTDLDASIRFYTEVLGLVVDFVHRDFYAGIRAGRQVFHLKRVDAPDRSIAEVAADHHFHLYLETAGVGEVAARLKGLGVPLVEDVHDTSWGTREIVIRDDQGHTLYLGEPIR
ncbi:MAG: FMN-binding negative transcriptional regulator [Lysobacterales bacterium]